MAETGVAPETITLHVGYGTFKPVRVEQIEDHVVDPERYAVSQEAADAMQFRTLLQFRHQPMS